MKRVKGDTKLVTFALLLIDGMLEEKRSRIENLVAIQRSKKKDKAEDLIGVLNSFLWSNNTEIQKDLASHILSMLIEYASLIISCRAHEYTNCES